MDISRLPQNQSMGVCGESSRSEKEEYVGDDIDIDSFSDLQNEEEEKEEVEEEKEEEEEVERNATEDGRNGDGNICDEDEEEGEGEEEKKVECKMESLELENVEEVKSVNDREDASGAGTMTDSVTDDWRLAVGPTHALPVDNNWILTDGFKKNFNSGCIINDLNPLNDDNGTPSYTCSALVDLLCGLYALFLSVVGCVLAMANALTKDINEESYYLQALYVYIYGVTIAFLIYLHVIIRRQRQKTLRRRTRFRSNAKKPNLLSTGKNNQCTLSTVSDNSACYSTRAVATILDIQMTPVNKKGWRNISFGAAGVNFYLRLGAIGFGTGSMIQDGFNLVQYIEDGQITFRCQGPFSIVAVILHVVFVFLQTFFIFKYHKIVVNVNKAVVKFGLMHMVATNVCVWFATTVTECHRDLLVNPRQAFSSSSSFSSFSNITMQTNAYSGEAPASCDYESTLVWKAAPYLFPCTIEYSLIAAAIAYKMYCNVGCLYPKQKHQQHSSLAIADSSSMRRAAAAASSANESVNCNKANKGLFVGLLVSVLTMVAVSCYYVFGDRLSFYGVHSSSILFFSTEILLLFVVFVGVVIAFFQFQRMRSFREEMESKLDPSLLFISLCGVFCLESFHLVSSVSSISFGQAVPILAFGCSVLTVTQSALQTVFITDALHRRAMDRVQAERKPGRSVVVFLLLCNLSLWIVCIFEVKKAENIPIHSDFYGSGAWNIIRDMCVPLIIFFRFHSTVCLSEIWINAYTLKEKGVAN